MKTMKVCGLLTHETAIEMVDELTFSSYSYNRSRSPHVTPEQWRKCCPGFSQAMEDRYQKELKASKEAMI